MYYSGKGGQNDAVMAGLGPAIHVFIAASKSWMPGTGPGMTVKA
jgi:hypothetical protein